MSEVRQNSRDLVVISDLHLSAGCPDREGKFSCNEDLFFDEEFRRFLRHLQNEKPGNTHLVIAGDLFDFLQVHGSCTAELVHGGAASSGIAGTEPTHGWGRRKVKGAVLEEGWRPPAPIDKSG